MTTTLKQIVVSVDTEEEGLWSGEYKSTGHTTENLRGLPRFQSLCESLGVPPTYLIDAPVLSDATAVSDLKKWQDAGLCEVGAHCHPWCNPPLDTQSDSFHSYLSNLDEETQYAKLKWLTDTITEKMQQAPLSYRAGRYGFNQTSAKILTELGYLVDSSVVPIHDYSSQGGPNYQYSNRQPYELFRPECEHRLIEIPITTGFTKPGFEQRRQTWVRLRSPGWKRFRAAGIADRVGLARRVKLTPEGTRTKDLIGLIDACVKDGLTTLVMMLHSSSLMPGHSYYVRDDKSLEDFYQRLSLSIKHAIEKHRFEPATLTTAARNLAPESLSFSSIELSKTSSL